MHANAVALCTETLRIAPCNVVNHILPAAARTSLSVAASRSDGSSSASSSAVPLAASSAVSPPAPSAAAGGAAAAAGVGVLRLAFFGALGAFFGGGFATAALGSGGATAAGALASTASAPNATCACAPDHLCRALACASSKWRSNVSQAAHRVSQRRRRGRSVLEPHGALLARERAEARVDDGVMLRAERHAHGLLHYSLHVRRILRVSRLVCTPPPRSCARDVPCSPVTTSRNRGRDGAAACEPGCDART